MKQQSPMLRLWELGEGQQGGLKRAVLSAVVGVLFGMLPYFAAAQITLGLLKGEQSMQYYLIWCVVALVCFHTIGNGILGRAYIQIKKQ